jgi:RNA polymerase sigma-70 factor (ECF subfamily)
LGRRKFEDKNRTEKGGDRQNWSSLMARAQSGDREAYRRLLTEVTPYIRALAAKYLRESADVEDTSQDVLLTVHAIRHTYDPTRPFVPWLTAIIRRRVVDRLRKHGRTRGRETPLEPRHETFEFPAANQDSGRWDAEALRNAVARLPPRQERAVTLLKLQEMSLKEAAAASGMTVASLKVATHRGIRALRNLLKPRADRS